MMHGDTQGYMLFTYLLLTVSTVHSQSGVSSPGSMYLDDGYYKGILIAVDQAVEFHEKVLPNIKEYFLQASDALYEATREVSGRRFGDVTILFPRSWPPLEQCQSVSLENQNAANFIVEADTLQWRSNPHTLKIDSRCGTPGKTTYLPRSFIIDKTEARKYGENIGKTILHEWGHLRYGLGDELEETNNPQTCQMFENGVMKPFKCSTDIQGVFSQSEDGGCRFDAHLEQEEYVKGSIMYLPYIDSVTTFCNKTGAGITHNSGIPNPHNDRCNGQSAWQVLMQNPDFKQHNVSTPPAVNNINFRCVQEFDVDRMVLVMDVSGSMNEEHRLERMNQDVSAFLKSLPCRDTAIGMVQFSGTDEETTILHPLAQLNKGDNLQSLINAIPRQTIEHTCIGCGIRKAIQLIEESSLKATNGTVLAIFTDGMENMEPYIQDVAQEVNLRGIVVYSIMLMTQARDHPLAKLSQQTGGKSCTFSDNQHTTYYDCLSRILHHRSPLTAPSQIVSEVISLPKRESHTGHFTIDNDLAQHAQFVLSWPSAYLAGCEDTMVFLTSPNNYTIDKYSGDIYDYKYNLRTITIDISAYLSGQWSYKLTNMNHGSECLAHMIVEATQLFDDCTRGAGVLSTESDLPLLISPTIDDQKVVIDEGNDPLDNAIKLYTDVRKGPYAVIDAIVNADIENENGEHWIVPLYDSGTGADAVAHDGVYSRYFTGFNKDGTYMATFNVIGNNNTKILIKSDKLSQMAAPMIPMYRSNATGEEYQSIGSFQRTTVAGFFEVVNYDESERTSSQPVDTWFPPPQIADLRIVNVDQSLHIIDITWTAVGDRLDHGIASSYDMRICDSPDKLRSSFTSCHPVTDSEVLTGNLTIAKDVGQKEYFQIKPNAIRINSVYYIAVKTINSHNKQSRISNLVMFQFILIRTRTSTNTAPGIASSVTPSTHDRTSTLHTINTDDHMTADNQSKSSFPSWIYWIIAGLGAGFLLTVLILMMVCCSKYPGNGRSKGKDSEENKNCAYENTVTLDSVTLTVEQQNMEQEPDLIRETHSKTSGQHATWPAANKYHARKKKEKKKKSTMIFRSIGRAQLFNGLRKKRTSGKSTEISEADNSGKRLDTSVPLQDHPYSNPLYGNAVMVPEILVHNSIIVQDTQNP